MPTTMTLSTVSRCLGEAPDEMIRNFINGGDAAWRAWVDESGAFEDMVRAFLSAVDARLPEGAWLAGDEIHILAGQPQDVEAAILAEVRKRLGDIDAVLEAIVEEHAPVTPRLENSEP